MSQLRFACAAWVVACGLMVTAGAKDIALPPLSIAQQGYFFVGGKYSTANDRQVMTDQLYVEFLIPGKQTHPWPIVMVHGLGQTGTNFTGTADGREGWAHYFLRRGFPVYIVDVPGRGRAGFVPDQFNDVKAGVAQPNTQAVLRAWDS